MSILCVPTFFQYSPPLLQQKLGNWVLPPGLPWIPESEVISNGDSKVRGARGIDPSQFLALIHLLHQFFGKQLPPSRRPMLPCILASEVNMLAVGQTGQEVGIPLFLGCLQNFCPVTDVHFLTSFWKFYYVVGVCRPISKIHVSFFLSFFAFRLMSILLRLGQPDQLSWENPIVDPGRVLSTCCGANHCTVSYLLCSTTIYF